MMHRIITIAEWMVEESDLRRICKTAYQGFSNKEFAYWEPKISAVLSPCKEATSQDLYEVRKAVAEVMNNGLDTEDELGDLFSYIDSLEVDELEVGCLIENISEDAMKHRMAFMRSFVIGSLKMECPPNMTETERVTLIHEHSKSNFPEEVEKILREQQLKSAQLIDQRRAEKEAEMENAPVAETPATPVEMPPRAIRIAAEDGYLQESGSKYINQKSSCKELIRILKRKYGQDAPDQNDIINWVVSKKNGQPYDKSTVSVAFKKVD